jgi:hypothetical protein
MNVITRNELGRIPLPMETQTYKPVPHLTYIEAILEEADKRHFQLVRESYDLAREGNVMVGRMVFRGEEPGMDLQIGALNSYDKTKAAVIALGAQVFICMNGMVSADYQLKRKHTTNVWGDLTGLIQSGVGNLYTEYTKNIVAKNRFSDMDLNKRAQAELLGRLFVQEEILTPTMASTVKAEITGSKLFPEDNVWSFYNHVTHALKQSHPSEYIDRHVGFHEFMDINFS